jgi:peptidyl-prolyl cis-trans isomerase B (cyclophilin B)
MPLSRTPSSTLTFPVSFRVLAATVCVTTVVAVMTCCQVAAQTTADPKLPEVELDTTAGKITIELDSVKAPKTVANFLDYVKSGHYNGTIFHRVIPDFMIQGGGLDGNMKEKKTKPPIVNEGGNGLTNKKYSLAMARTNDPNSATSQFFINTKDNAFLNRSSVNPGYAVFGRVVKGLGVVDAISKSKTTSKENGDVPGMRMRDVPVTAITIKTAKVIK